MEDIKPLNALSAIGHIEIIDIIKFRKNRIKISILVEKSPYYSIRLEP